MTESETERGGGAAYHAAGSALLSSLVLVCCEREADVCLPGQKLGFSLEAFLGAPLSRFPFSETLLFWTGTLKDTYPTF